MRCWFICLFLILEVSSQPNLEVAGKEAVQSRHGEGHIHKLLQRRGGKEKPQSGAGKSGSDGKLPANPGSPILPPRRNLFILNPQQSESPKSQDKETSLLRSASPPRNPPIAASRQPEFPGFQDSRLPRVPFAPPPRPAFTAPSEHAGPSVQVPQGKRERTKRSKTKAKESTIPADPQSEFSRLRMMQGSGATQRTSDIEGPPRTPFEISPPYPQANPVQEKQSTSPHSKSPSSSPQGDPSSSQQRTSPQRRLIPLPQRPPPDPPLPIDEGVPAAKGIHWLPQQKRITSNWKQHGEAERANQAAIQRATGIAKNDKDLARTTRHLDDQHLREARTAMSNGRALDPDVMSAVQKSKSSSRKAQAFSHALSRSHGEAAELLAQSNRYTEGVSHFQRANRAFARHELRMQRGQALDYKYIDKGVKDGLAKLAAEGGTPSTAMIQRAVAMRRTYKTAAEAYHQSWRDYQTVRQEFSGSSSDESEKSAFDDIVPPNPPPPPPPSSSSSSSAAAAAGGRRKDKKEEKGGRGGEAKDGGGESER